MPEGAKDKSILRIFPKNLNSAVILRGAFSAPRSDYSVFKSNPDIRPNSGKACKDSAERSALAATPVSSKWPTQAVRNHLAAVDAIARKTVKWRRVAAVGPNS